MCETELLPDGIYHVRRTADWCQSMQHYSREGGDNSSHRTHSAACIALSLSSCNRLSFSPHPPCICFTCSSKAEIDDDFSAHFAFKFLNEMALWWELYILVRRLRERKFESSIGNLRIRFDRCQHQQRTRAAELDKCFSVSHSCSAKLHTTCKYLFTKGKTYMCMHLI